MSVGKKDNISALEWRDVDGVSRAVMGKWLKHGIVFPQDQPWEEDKWIGAFPSTVIIDGDRKMLYYYVYSDDVFEYNLAIAELENGGTGAWQKHPLSRNTKDYFSIEGLPEGWCPIQPNVIKIKPGFWRMYFWVHGKGICRFLAAESHNGLNWKILNAQSPCLYHVGNDHAARYGSAPRELCANDATTVYLLPDGTFEMYSAALLITEPGDNRYVGHDISPGAVRFIQRWTSGDGLNWNRPEIVLVPDDKDPVDLQFYYLSVAYMKNYRLGFTGYYTVENQIQGLEMILSRDGVHWTRPVRGNCFPMDKKYDCYGVYAPHNFLIEGDKMIMYYTGTNATHNKQKCSGDSPQKIIATASINYRKVFGCQVKDGCLVSPPLKLSDMDLSIYLEGTAEIRWCNVLGRELADCAVHEIIPDTDTEYCTVMIPERLKHQAACLKLSGNFILFDLEY